MFDLQNVGICNLCLMMKLLTITLMIKGQDKENDDKHSLDTFCN